MMKQLTNIYTIAIALHYIVDDVLKKKYQVWYIENEIVVKW